MGLTVTRADLRSTAKRGVRSLGVATAWSRPFPGALVIGAKRSGTTSLWRALEAHPAVLPLFPSARMLPLRANQKGVHYYDRGYRNGSHWYRSHFPTETALAVRRSRAGQALACEASPGYLVHPEAAARVAADMPAVRLVVMLRDPVARAYSHWKEQVRDGHEHLGFEAALAAEPARLNVIDRNGDDLGRALEHYGYLSQSRYDIALRRWLAHFGHEQVLVLLAESFFADPDETMDRLVDFLRIHRLRRYAVRPENAAPATDLEPAVARALQSTLQPSIDRTEQILGRPLPWAA